MPDSIPFEAEIQEALKYHQNKNFDEAEKHYLKIIKKNPQNSLVLSLYATLLLEQGKNSEAIEIFKESLLIDPNQPMVYCNLGVAFFKNKEFLIALENYNLAINMKPDYFEAYRFKAIVLKVLNKPQESLDFFNQAIALNPTFAATYFDLANLFEERKLYDDAVKVYDRLISLMPKNTDAYIYKGNLLHSIDRYSEELDNYDKAIELGLNVKLILGRKLRSLMYLNDWENFDSLVEEIINQTNLGLAAANPFTLLSVIDNPALIKKSVEQYTNFINPNKNRSYLYWWRWRWWTPFYGNSNPIIRWFRRRCA